MFKYLILPLLLLSVVAQAADKPVTLSISYDITGTRKANCSAVAIGPKLLLSCDHAVRDDECSLGHLIAVDRKYDRALVELDVAVSVWSPVRETALQSGETVYFNGGTARFDGQELKVTSGRIIYGMSGGPIWDKDNKIVSVISEYDTDRKLLYGYQGLSQWVSQHSPEQQQPQPVDAPTVDLQAVRARIAELAGGSAPQQPQQALRLEYYGASWCGPCRRVGKPALAQLDAEAEGVTVEQYDIDSAKGQELGQQRKVGNVPTYILFDGDKEVARKVGALHLAELKKFLKERKAQPQKPDTSTAPTPFVRIFVNGRANGSGGIIGEKDGNWLVITARHVIGKSNNVKVEIGDEQREATVVKRGTPDEDAAALTVARKTETITPIPIADKGPGVGATVDTHGYPRAEKYDPKPAKVIGDRNGTDTISGYFIGGVSGGVVTYEGNVVGIFSTSNRSTWANIIDAETLSQFMTRTFVGEAEPDYDGENPPPGYHSHKCQSCGTVWVHQPGPNASHNCPNCGRQQLVIHRQGRRAA